MALLEMMSEEPIAEDRARDYFERLYQVVCVAEKPGSVADSEVVRTTYVVDWEQLVHLLEGYELFGEDIVEVKAMGYQEGLLLRHSFGLPVPLALA